MTHEEQIELDRILVDLEAARADALATRKIARQLRAALADLVPPHSSWCMEHEGGVQTAPDGTRVGIGPLVAKRCRCEEAVQRGREALQASAYVVGR
jgi:hypothetical protein